MCLERDLQFPTTRASVPRYRDKSLGGAASRTARNTRSLHCSACPQPLMVLDACEKPSLAHVFETNTHLCQSVWNLRLTARRQCLRLCNSARRGRDTCVLPCFCRTPLRHNASISACCWRVRCCALTNAKKTSVSI